MSVEKLGTAREQHDPIPSRWKALLKNKIVQVLPELACEVDGIDCTPIPLPNLADVLPNFAVIPAAQRAYEKALWDGQGLKLYQNNLKRVEDQNILIEKTRPKIATWIREQVTSDLTTVAETMWPDIHGDPAASYRLSGSIIDTVSRSIKVHNNSISIDHRVIKKYRKDELKALVYSSSMTTDSYLQKFRDLLQAAVDAGNVIQERDCMDIVLSQLPDRYSDFKETMLKEEDAKQANALYGGGPEAYLAQGHLGFPLTFEFFVGKLKAYESTLERLSAPSKKKSGSSARSYSSLGSEPLTNKLTGEVVAWEDLTKDDNPADFGKSPCRICIRNGYSGEHFAMCHDDAMESWRRKREQEKPRGRNRSRSPETSSRERTRGRKGSRSRSRSNDSAFSRASSKDSYRDKKRNTNKTPSPQVTFKTTSSREN